MEPELPPIDDPIELLALLRAGDRVHHCIGSGWRLLRSNVPVSELAVRVLRGSGIWLIKENGNEPFDFGGGCLVPMGDGLPLPGLNMAQTYGWAEGRSNMKH